MLLVRGFMSGRELNSMLGFPGNTVTSRVLDFDSHSEAAT